MLPDKTINQEVRRADGARLSCSLCMRVLVAATLACTWSATAQAGDPQEPDAVIETWDQSWSVDVHGALVYRERKEVRLNSDRAYREFADPRITYNTRTQTVNVITARTRLPDGSTVDVPDYSRNEVSPRGSAGWPAFSSIHQVVLTFSGIQPGCVLELEYEITTNQGAWSQIVADQRIDHRYLIRSRSQTLENLTTARVDILNSHGLKLQTDATVVGTDENGVSYRAGKTSTWTFSDVPAAGSDEPHDPPWQAFRPRLALSTHENPADWVKGLTAAIEAAADESPEIWTLAEKWAGPEADPSEKIRGLQRQLAATFNFVDFPIEWRNARAPRSATDVLTGNYGVPEESAAALLALARARGLAARPALLVSDDVWLDNVCQDGFVRAFVILVDTGAPAPEIWSPSQGLITRDRRWAGSKVLTCDSNRLETVELPAWTAPDDSTCRIVGDLTIGNDGAYSADLRLHLSGMFVTRDTLRTTDQQRARVAELLSRVVPDADIARLDVGLLTDVSFDADVELKSHNAVTAADGLYRFALPQDGPALAEVPLPLNYSQRRTPVQLPGAYDVQIELTVHWPDSWNLQALPIHIGQTSGDGSSVEQFAKAVTGGALLARHIRLDGPEIAAADFLKLRSGLNRIRADAGRTIMLQTSTPD